MRDQLSRLLLMMVEDYFGPVCSSTAEVVLSLERATLGQIVSNSNLSLRQTRTALAVMISHHLVFYRQEGGKTWYSVSTENILAVRKYPEYLDLVRSSQGETAANILEEIIRTGSLSLSLLLHGFGCTVETEERTKLYQAIHSYKKSFNSLLSDGYIKSVDSQKSDIDVKDVVDAVLSDGGRQHLEKDRVKFMLNLDKLALVVRNKMMASAAARRLYDEGAGAVLQSMLELAGDSPVPGPSSYADILKQLSSQQGSSSEAVTFLDQQLRLLQDDRTRFILKVGDDGGGKYQVNIRNILLSISETVLDSVVMERFCSKSARVFRFIRSKKYVEEADLQGAVMIPSKETKEITYKLLENHFIHLQELRKTISSTAPTKSLYLYYVDIYQVVRSVLQSCYKASANLMLRAKHERQTNARLLEKQERTESLVESLRAGGASEAEISEEVTDMITPPEQETLQEVQTKLNKISGAQSEVCDNMLLLRLVLELKSKS